MSNDVYYLCTYHLCKLTVHCRSAQPICDREQKRQIVFIYERSGKLKMLKIRWVPSRGYVGGGDEIGGVYLPSQLERTLQFCT
jgi:hypothetical protein